MCKKETVLFSLLFVLSVLLGGCTWTEENSGTEVSSVESRESNREESEASVSSEPRTVDWKLDLSKVPANWRQWPRILRFGISPEEWDTKGEGSGASFTETVYPVIEYGLDQYWEKMQTGSLYTISDRKYTLNSLVNTGTEEYSSELTPLVIPSSDTWVMSLSAACKINGVLITGDTLTEAPSEPGEYTITNWDFEGQTNWVLRQRENFLYMMTYADYAYARMTLNNEEDPFDHDWAGRRAFKGKYVYESGSEEPPEGTYYFEPLQGYLYEGSIVYRYEAPTAQTNDEALNKAALELGHQYMQEMCSKPYDEGTGMEVNYKIWEYKDLKVTVVNRMKDVYGLPVEISNPKNAGWDWMGSTFIRSHTGQYGVEGLVKSENLWILEYDVTAKIDGGGYGASGPVSRDEWLRPENGGYFKGNDGIMIKDGSTYYLVFARDVVPRSCVPA